MPVPQLTEAVIAELKRMVGKESEPYQVEITKDIIRHLAEAVGDVNPLWQDGKKAEKSRHGGMIAPPALYICNLMNAVRQRKLTLPPEGKHLDAWQEWEFYTPIRPNDVITVTCRVADVYERRGRKSGRMVFFVLETTFTNQRGEKVGLVRGSSVRY